jgi:hypothetical protein
MRLALRTRDAVHARCDDDPSPIAVLHPVAVRDAALGDMHPEDAFLAELRAFLGRGLDARERRCADDIARDALDLVDGPEGDFSGVAVGRWRASALAAAMRAGVGAASARRLAGGFVAFLYAQGKLDAA